MDEDKVMPTPSYKVVFYYLRYWGMWFNWTMRNEFLFDALHGIAQQIRRMKEKLILAIFTTMLYGDLVPRGDRLMSSSFTTFERVSLALSLFIK